jgi:hypothetical protein
LSCTQQACQLRLSAASQVLHCPEMPKVDARHGGSYASWNGPSWYQCAAYFIRYLLARGQPQVSL